jgi:cobalt-zinc-cadmium efflux system outer membrane protein
LAGCQSIDRAPRAVYDNRSPDAQLPFLTTGVAGRGDVSAATADRTEVHRLPAVPSASVIPSAAVQVVAYQEPTDFGSEPQSLAQVERPPADLDAAAMTLNELVELALAGNPAVARANAQINALCGKWLQVGLPPNPTIGYVGGEIGDDGKAGQQGGFASQQFITAGKLGLNRSVVAQEIARAEQELAAVQQRVLTDVRVAYYDVLIAQRQVQLARDLVRISDQAVETSRDLLQAQEVSQVALLQSEVQAQDAQILLRRAMNEIDASWRRLASVVGDAQLSPQPLAGDLEETVTDILWDAALQRLLSESPEIAAASADLDRARWALQRACVEIKPNVNVQMSVQHDDATDDVIGGVQVGVPVPILNRNQGAIRQARAEITAAEQNIQRLELELRERLAETFRQYANSRFAVAKYTKEILPKASQTLDLVTLGYRQGEVGYLDQLTAQRTFFQTNIAYIEALRELWRGTIRIEGLLLTGSLAEKSER